MIASRLSVALIGSLLGALPASSGVGCGDDEGAPADVGEADASDGADTSAGDTAETSPETVDDTLEPPPDAPFEEVDGGDAADAADGDHDGETGDAGDAGDADSGPTLCDDFFACDAPLDADGRCPGTCRPTDDTLRCAGTVVHAVCHTLAPIDAPTEPADFGDFTVTPVRWPEDAILGERYALEVRVDNDTAAPLSIPLRWKIPGTWLIEEPSWEGLESIELAPNGSLSLTAQITALHPTVLSTGSDMIVTFVFGERAYEPRAAVHFPDTEPIACGGEHFPQTWCPSEDCYQSRQFYVSARCCDEVFFPGATCCDDTDCLGGACVDGRCVFSAPSLGSANNAPIGHQRIRLVLVDSHPQFTDPCADHYEDVQGEIDLQTVEAWYDDLAVRRLGRDAVDFRWIVTGGVATSDFLTGPAWWDNYGRELDAWLEQRGCPIFDAYDKVIVSASTVDLMGFGGVYYDRGHIAVFSPYSPYLLAHELAHSFGASDLYLDLGGTFLYPLDLMGNRLSAPPLPGDKVAWAEMGFGDVDRNGVLDAVELAAFPEALDVAGLTATITPKDTLELRWEFVAVEGDAERRVVVPTYRVRVPLVDADFEQTYAGRWKTITFDHTQLDLAALEAAGVIEVGLGASYRFTDRDWQPRVLAFDRTYQVPVTRSP